jgi:outer membrane protein assembly factor BamB
MKTRTLLVGFCLLGLSLPAFSADWPQWRGPNRDDVSTETGLLKTWPKEGPKLLWTYSDLGIGYSGPSVVGEHIYTMGCRDDIEFLICLSTKDGSQVWAAKIGPRFNNGYGDGPRANPTVDGDAVYALGGQGNLICTDLKGSIRWQVRMQRDPKNPKEPHLNGKMMSGWGYTESVLVDGDKVVCTPGGQDGTFAALNKKDGKVIWRSKELKAPAAYSSIVIATIGNVKQYVNMIGGGEAAVAAEDGKLLWKSDAAQNGTAIVPTPVINKDQVYVTSGYGAGCGLLKITADGPKFDVKTVYTNKTMTNHHGGVVLLDKYIYGYSDSGGWTCQDLESGAKKWAERKLNKGSVTYADGHLYCYTENDGTCVLAAATPQGWKEDGRFKIPQQTKQVRKSGHIWTHPVVANGRLYLRDQDLLFCFDVSGSK